jgi:hypothetical protein
MVIPATANVFGAIFAHICSRNFNPLTDSSQKKHGLKMKTKHYDMIVLVITRIGFFIASGSLIAIQFSNSNPVL